MPDLIISANLVIPESAMSSEVVFRWVGLSPASDFSSPDPCFFEVEPVSVVDFSSPLLVGSRDSRLFGTGCSDDGLSLSTEDSLPVVAFDLCGIRFSSCLLTIRTVDVVLTWWV